MGLRNFPKGWIPEDEKKFTPEFMKLQGKDYLEVAKRMLWFIDEQRLLISQNEGELRRKGYSIEILGHEVDWGKPEFRKWKDRYGKDKEGWQNDTGHAWYSIRVTDVMGSSIEATGSEFSFSFEDFDEKAYTKAVGRCLAWLGYSTGAAQELDESQTTTSGETRVVDAPQAPPMRDNAKATDEQVEELKKLYPQVPEAAFKGLTEAAAAKKITDAKAKVSVAS